MQKRYQCEFTEAESFLVWALHRLPNSGILLTLSFLFPPPNTFLSSFVQFAPDTGYLKAWRSPKSVRLVSTENTLIFS